MHTKIAKPTSIFYIGKYIFPRLEANTSKVTLIYLLLKNPYRKYIVKARNISTMFY